MRSAQKSFSDATGWRDAEQELFRGEFNKPTADITTGPDYEPYLKKNKTHSAITDLK